MTTQLQATAKTGNDPLLSPSGNLGADLRALRKSRRMTLHQMAGLLERSVGFVSQVERGISSPSIDDLRTIAREFGVPLGLFFGKPAAAHKEEGYVVRSQNRRVIGNHDEGLTEELLSPDLGGSFEAIRSVFAPGAELASPQQRDTEEAGYVVSGELELMIGKEWFSLNAGDSFRFCGESYQWKNIGKQDAVVIWIVSPPTY